ncbi:MAG TPA: phenylalanine--tRNA ligase subunit beta [Gaiellaceae bacterium]|nr:phenylalanine--tRNA ligase subunit beta [Gaiellaceae bacterium]
MKVPVSWLRDYVAIEMPLDDLVGRLAVSTCEVERVAPRGVADVDGNLGLFRVGRVVEAGKHPNADRLQLCRVDVGEPEPRQIVCGAWNFGAGATVAVALPGARLPDGRTLERAKLRGAVSDGMILSEQELELGPDHSGILVLEGEYEPGTPLADVLPLSDQVLEVEVTGNRPDLLCVYGIAREISALYGLRLAPPPGREPQRTGDEPVDVRIDDLAGCPRYVGRLFRGVRIAPSPPWLRARLSASGVRPISNVVDVTNYVMLALGSPLHAFDYARLAGGRVVVRRAARGEELRTLDGTLRMLDEHDLVIADAQRAVALAGIMGGLETEVTDETTEVLLEAANFEPVGILRSSERFGLRTEGSNRWEKGVDPHVAGQAAAMASELIVQLAGARLVGQVDVQGELPERPVLRLRPERTSALVGLELPEDEQRRVLEGLGFDVSDDWTVTVPTWRARDVTREIDLVEEVARFELDRVPFTLPRRQELFGQLTRDQRLRRTVEDVLVGCGLTETYTPSLVSAEQAPAGAALPTPLSAEHAVLRTSLLPSLVDAVRRNVDAGTADVALFEVARVYVPRPGELPDEPWRVGGILRAGFFRVKGIVEVLHASLHAPARFEPAEEPFLHPGRAARVEAGWLGELHPAVLEGWAAFELDLAELFRRSPDAVVYEDVLTHPPVRQDLAFVVDESVPAAALVEAAREAAGAELRAMRAFDVYRGAQVGEGRKSIAFSVTFQSPERTLSDEDAAVLRGRIVAALRERFGAELRASTGSPAAGC